MVKGIGWRYKKYKNQNNWPYPSPNYTFVIPNQSNITNTTQCNNILGSPVSQYITNINNTQGNELSSHGTGRLHNASSQNDDLQYFKTHREIFLLLQQITDTNPNQLYPRK